MAHRPLAVPVLVAVLAAASCQSSPNAPKDRVVRGKGIVTGLAGTGSSDLETREAILAFARDHGFRIQGNDIPEGTLAMVNVTGTVPAGATLGQTIEVRCEAVKAGVSLRAGTLLRCALHDEDSKTIVVVQGSVITMAAEPSSPVGWVRGGIVVR